MLIIVPVYLQEGNKKTDIGSIFVDSISFLAGKANIIIIESEMRNLPILF